jgi:rod shape-determining protein MreC
VVIVKKNSRLVVLGFFLLCGFWCFSKVGMHYATMVGSYFVYPMLCVHHRCVSYVEDWRKTKKSLQELEDTVEGLRTECDMVRAENSALKAMLSYADDIADIIAFKKKLGHADDVIAQVIARYIADDEHYILVDAGSAVGVERDMIALVYNNVVGRVIEVYPWYAKVQLITDPNSYVASYMATTKARGIHKGLGLPFETRVERISHLDEIHLGDDVITSGEGLIFPRGYHIGKVIAKASLGLYYEVKLKPAVDPVALRYCIIHKRN